MQIKGSKVTCKENEEWITINLDSNPNLLADSIYLLNKLLDEQDVLPRKDTEEKKEILKTSISERLVGDQKKIFLDWQEVTQAISEGNLTTRQKLMEVFHKKRLFSLEEKAKVCVLFQELINDIKDKKEKKFKEQFYANYSLNDNELSESIEVYHYLHPFENEKIAKSMNNIEQLSAIEQSVVKINKDDSDKSVEEKFRDHLSNYPIILNLIKEQPEIGKKLLKKCQDRLPFVSLTSSKEFREIVDNEFAIRNTNIRKFARKHAPQVRSQMTVEKQIYDLYQENPAWCCENLRAILVDYVGFKNINLNPIYRPKLYSFQACGNFDQWRLRGKAQKIINFYTGIASNLERVLPKELQEKEPVNKERQTEISLESIVTKHEKLNNDMVLTETNEKKKLFPATDYFESKSNLRQREPLIKKLHMTQIKEKASQEGYSSNERKTHEQVQRQANR